MMKFYPYLILMYPMILNITIIMMMMFPSKMNNFHPISMMIILINLILLICLKINFIHKSWIPFILFLIMIGGLLVIFMYITSLANNEYFNFNFKLMIMNFIKIFPIMILMIYLILKFKFMIFNLNFESMNINNFMMMKNQDNLNIMYKELNNKSTYFIMMYLYYSMICIMSICYKLKIPLRQILF